MDGELGELIKLVNRDGYKGMKLEEFRCWYLSGWEKHGEKFQLGFVPEPDYTPTKILIKILKDAGFGAEVVTVEERNCEYYTTADGYDCRDLPGTHPRHYLVITWE